MRMMVKEPLIRLMLPQGEARLAQHRTPLSQPGSPLPHRTCGTHPPHPHKHWQQQ